MSTFPIPSWFGPVFDFYNLKWPDIDEDQVAELGNQIATVALDVYIFSLAVKRCLGELSEESEAKALAALAESWSEYTNGPVSTATDIIGEGARNVCTTIANGITTYKAGVLATLTINVGSDLLLIASGVGAPAAIAKKAVMREILEYALHEAAVQASNYLLGFFNDLYDTLVVKPIKDLATDIGKLLGDQVSEIAVMAVPTRAASVELARLYIDHDDIVHAAAQLKNAYTRLEESVEKLTKWSKGSGYVDVKAPSPDSTVRLTLQQAFDWAADAFVAELKNIGSDIINNMLSVTTEIYEKYVEADTELGRLGEQLREQFRFPPPPTAFAIDRSKRPEPTIIYDAPPPIMTGEGISDARFAIEVIDLPDAPEPVVTGEGVSDARFDIKVIDLPDAPEIVITGPADSDARNRIRKIDLPVEPT